MAVAVWTSTTINEVLDNTTPKGVQFINAWIRDYPALSYVGLYLNNYYKDGGKMQRGTLTYTEQTAVRFKSIGALETDMSVNENQVTWYEAGLLLEEALVTAAITVADDEVTIEADKIKHFKVGDVVVLKPKLGGTTTEVQAEITAVNTTTNKITLDTNVTCAIDDRIVLAYNLIEYGTEITRWVSTWDLVPVTTYFQTFGESMEFNSNELNISRLFEDAQQYVNGKFKVAIAMANNRIAKTWYLGRNIAGSKSETQGIFHAINELETRYGAGSAIIDFAWVAAGKDKAKKLVQTLNYFNTAPIYQGTESPTVFCNDTFITNLSEIMFDMGNQFDLKVKDVEFGLQSYSSPYFRNVQFIVDNTLNRLEPFKSTAVVFPKHLVTFRAPEYQSVNEAGALVKHTAWAFQVLKMPQVSADRVKYTAQLRLANIFGWQSFKASYWMIKWL